MPVQRESTVAITKQRHICNVSKLTRECVLFSLSRSLALVRFFFIFFMNWSIMILNFLYYQINVEHFLAKIFLHTAKNAHNVYNFHSQLILTQQPVECHSSIVSVRLSLVDACIFLFIFFFEFNSSLSIAHNVLASKCGLISIKNGKLNRNQLMIFHTVVPLFFFCY